MSPFSVMKKPKTKQDKAFKLMNTIDSILYFSLKHLSVISCFKLFMNDLI